MKRVCLVLGGGGAKGILHIGTMEALTEAEVSIDSISGTSVGALIGAMYCAFYSRSPYPSDLEKQADAIRTLRTICIRFPFDKYLPTGVRDLWRLAAKGVAINSQNWEAQIETWLWDPVRDGAFSLSSLAKDLTIVWVLAETGERRVSNAASDGVASLASIVRKSSSIPLYFDLASDEAWDGGLAGNCPMGWDILEGKGDVVVSSLTYREGRRVPASKLRSFKAGLFHATDIALMHLEKLQLELLKLRGLDPIVVEAEYEGLDTLSFGLDRRERTKAVNQARQSASRKLPLARSTRRIDWAASDRLDHAEEIAMLKRFLRQQTSLRASDDRDQDLVRFGKLCYLSAFQIATKRAFSALERRSATRPGEDLRKFRWNCFTWMQSNQKRYLSMLSEAMDLYQVLRRVVEEYALRRMNELNCGRLPS